MLIIIVATLIHAHSYVVEGSECPEDTPYYCFDQNSAEFCYEGGVDLCYCTDTDNLGASSPPDVLWDDEAGICQSSARSMCLEYKEHLRAFYKGSCYDEKGCNDASLTWMQDGTHPASCTDTETLQYQCERIEHASWDSETGECTCEDPGAEFHGDHCHGGSEDHEDDVSVSKKWGYGIIASAIISVFAIFGVMVVLLREKWWYQHVLSTMVALAMGCLLSDAILHLIPLSLGLHNHDEGEGQDDHGHEEDGGSPSERTITVAITLGVYLFLLFEKAIKYLIPHQHSHGGEVHENTVVTEKSKEQDKGGAEAVEYVEMEDSKPPCDRKRSFVDHLHEEDVSTRDGSICSVDSVAWMIIFGDAMHNFADGLVMGAAFSSSLATGLATSIAVFCHEVPHELGDFAVLLNAGMKVKFAILFNFLSACTCFLGLFVGLAIGENDTAQKWFFALTAGMFIYISCVDLVPQLNKKKKNSKNPIVCFALQQVGLILGFIIMFVIAVYEEDIMKVGGGDGDH